MVGNKNCEQMWFFRVKSRHNLICSALPGQWFDKEEYKDAIETDDLYRLLVTGSLENIGDYYQVNLRTSGLELFQKVGLKKTVINLTKKDDFFKFPLPTVDDSSDDHSSTDGDEDSDSSVPDASDETFKIRGGRGRSRSGMLHRTKGKTFRYPDTFLDSASSDVMDDLDMSSLMPVKKRLRPPSPDPEISKFDSMCSMEPRFMMPAPQFQQSLRQKASDIIRTIDSDVNFNKDFEGDCGSKDTAELFFGKDVTGFTRVIRSRLYNMEYNALFELYNYYKKDTGTPSELNQSLIKLKDALSKIYNNPKYQLYL